MRQARVMGVRGTKPTARSGLVMRRTRATSGFIAYGDDDGAYGDHEYASRARMRSNGREYDGYEMRDDEDARAGERRRRGNEAEDDDDTVMLRAMGGIFTAALSALRWGLPLTGGLACWAAAAANTGGGLLSALSGALLVGTTLGVCALIFAAASATMSGLTLMYMMVRRSIFGGARKPTMRRRREIEEERDEEEDFRRAPLRRRDSRLAYGHDDDDDNDGGARVHQSMSFGDWTPEVPVVDPRLPGRWGGRNERVAGDANAWGTHRTPADFRREHDDSLRQQRERSARRNDGENPYGPSEWKSRAAYKQGAAHAANEDEERPTDPREEIIRKFEPAERLLPRTPPKPKHAYIPTETLIAMGGASLETHIKSVSAQGLAKASSGASRRPSGAATSSFNFSSARPSMMPPKPPGANGRGASSNRKERPDSYKIEDDDDWSDEFTRRARERFERNLSDAFEDSRASMYDIDHRRASEFPNRKSDDRRSNHGDDMFGLGRTR